MRTYVINLKTFTKIMLVTAAMAAVAVFMLSGQALSFYKKTLISLINEQETMIHVFPAFRAVYQEKSHAENNIIDFLFNEDMDNPDKVICGNIPVFRAIKSALAEMYSDVYESNFYYNPMKKENYIKLPEISVPQNVYKAIETTSRSVNKNGNHLEKKGITVKNHTSYVPDFSMLYNKPLNLRTDKKKTGVLIVHTHGTESYNPKDRSEDINENIVRVGTHMAEVFKKNNIDVVHSATMHDIPRFNSSYSKSYNTIEQELKKNPGIGIVLDVHRDAMIAENGDSYKVVCNYNGEKIAQVMFVVGTDGNGLSHPGWQENLALAMKLQEAMNRKCPDFARPIDLRNERFNQQTTNGTLIIEIGTNGNTLNEAVKAGELAAQVISEVINSL